MTEMINANVFRKALDDKATSLGAQRLFSTAELGGYVLNNMILEYQIEGDSITVIKTPSAPQRAVYAMLQHARNPELSIEEHEKAMFDKVELKWQEAPNCWKLINATFPLDESHARDLDHLGLADRCAEWLAN